MRGHAAFATICQSHRRADPGESRDDFGILFARLLLGVPFIIRGFGKLRHDGAELVPVLTTLGVPDPRALAWLVGLCELVGGLGVVLGFPVGLFGVLLGLWCLATAIEAHRNSETAILGHVVMSGGFFLLATTGPGAIALFGGR